MSPGRRAGAAAVKRRRPMSLSEVLERVLARGASEHSSVTLARNAKGDPTFEVIARTSEGGQFTTLEQAEAAAIAAYDRLEERYPFGSSE